MHVLRIDILGGNPKPKLRLLDAAGKQVGERVIVTASSQDFASNVQQSYRAAAANLRSVGQQLHDWLDGSADRWLGRAERTSEGLSLYLELGSELADLPWELLCDQGVYWCGLDHRPFTPVRQVTKQSGESPVQNRPLRVLFMASSPIDVSPTLNFEREESMILSVTSGQQIELVVEESGSLAGLGRRLEWAGPNYFDVIHLTGHADIVDGQPALLMENGIGQREDVSAADIGGALAGNWPRLTFLSGCKTGMAAEDRSVPSLGESLVREGAPAVLGWALPVGDESASVLAAELYHWLAIGRRIDESVARARAKSCDAKSAYWHLLRLYANGKPLSEIVTPLSEPHRARLTIRGAAKEFLDAGSKSEVCPHDKFVGRRRLLQRGLRVLGSGQNAPDYAEGLLLHGMGGLGKSSLAARLCERMPQWQRLVWVGALDEAQFLRVLGDRLEDADVLAELNDARLSLSVRLKKLLSGYLLKHPAIFVFDDFEQNAEVDEEQNARFDAEQRMLIRPAALDIVSAVLKAIRQANSDSRVLVTCRYDLAGHDGLRRLTLGGFKEADLDKKLQLLESFEKPADRDDELRQRAIELAGGNPRLLERLDRVLADKSTDGKTILDEMAQKAAEFREETLLRVLIDQQDPAARQMLARWSVFHLPVERSSLEAVGDGGNLAQFLSRAVAVGLVERLESPAAQEPRHLVSRVLDPLLRGELTEEQWEESYRGATACLHQSWATSPGSLESGIEVHRLALLAKNQAIAVEVGDLIATHLISQSRFREALLLCELTRSLGDDFRILHTQARAEEVLGEVEEAKQHYEEALRACSPADDAPEAIKRERAAILSNMAGVIAQQGDVSRALSLWEESLQLLGQIGDVKGKAATLANMAGAAGQQDDAERELELNLEAARALVQARAWGDLTTVLSNLGTSDDQSTAIRYLAQAVWLLLRVTRPVAVSVRTAAALLGNIGTDAEAAPWVAAAGALFAHTRGEKDPQREEMQQLALNMLGACAQARQIEQDAVEQWLQDEGLLDPPTFLPRLEAALNEIVGEQGWLFDRSLLPQLANP